VKTLAMATAVTMRSKTMSVARPGDGGAAFVDGFLDG